MADPPPPSNQGPTCSPLEQEVLDEYALLLANLNKVRPPEHPCNLEFKWNLAYLRTLI